MRASKAGACRQVEEEEQAVSGNTRTRNTTKLAFGSSLSANWTPLCLFFFPQVTEDKCSTLCCLGDSRDMPRW